MKILEGMVNENAKPTTHHSGGHCCDYPVFCIPGLRCVSKSASKSTLISHLVYINAISRVVVFTKCLCVKHCSKIHMKAQVLLAGSLTPSGD